MSKYIVTMLLAGPNTPEFVFKNKNEAIEKAEYFFKKGIDETLILEAKFNFKLIKLEKNIIWMFGKEVK
jgi:hypothetical protein